MSAFYGNGLNPGGAIEYPGGLKPEAIKNLRESLNLVHQGSAAAYKMMILEQGMKWNPGTPISPQAAEILATRQFNVLEICRLLRVPPHKLQDYTHVQPTNLEIINDDYATSCVRPWCVRWESANDFKLLTERERKAGLYCRHNMGELLRANTKDRGEWYQKMSMIGLYNRDEIAALENMNPIGEKAGGEKRFRPANLIELDAKQPVPHPNQAPGLEKPKNEEKSRLEGYLNGHA
jgi:HK97 family phage portal protein